MSAIYTTQTHTRCGIGMALIMSLCHLAYAQGENFIDLSVHVDIEQTCTIVPADGGLYHYTTLPAGLVKSRETISLPPMTKTWAIQCSAPTTLSFEVQDLQADSVNGNDKTHFGLGFVNDAGKLGFYTVEISGATVDNDKMAFSVLDSVSTSSNHKPKMTVSQGQLIGWTRGEERTPSMGKAFTLDITVLPILNSLQETNGPLVSGAELNGQAQFIFTFGL